jgi:hypothetical protein
MCGEWWSGELNVNILRLRIFYFRVACTDKASICRLSALDFLWVVAYIDCGIKDSASRTGELIDWVLPIDIFTNIEDLTVAGVPHITTPGADSFWLSRCDCCCLCRLCYLWWSCCGKLCDAWLQEDKSCVYINIQDKSKVVPVRWRHRRVSSYSSTIFDLANRLS